MTRLQPRTALMATFVGVVGMVAASAQPLQPPLPQPAESPVTPGSIPLVRPQGLPPPPGAPAPLGVPPSRWPVPLAQPLQPQPPVQYTPHLAWESDFKSYRANAGEATAHFTFGLTNVSSIEVVVNRVSTSCGCTVARLPAQPWRLAPGASGQIEVTVDLRGKWGTLQKFITVDTSDGFKPLRVEVAIPASAAQPPVLLAGRARNMELARADRQAVFKNDCAGCHAQPTVGKTGGALFQAACAICHESSHRATMVPDLRALNHATDRPFWKSWVTSGKPGTLMPAFATAEGGPLTEAQIESLVDYLATSFPQRTAVIPSGPATLATPPPLPPLPPVPSGAAP